MQRARDAYRKMVVGYTRDHTDLPSNREMAERRKQKLLNDIQENHAKVLCDLENQRLKAAGDAATAKSKVEQEYQETLVELQAAADAASVTLKQVTAIVLAAEKACWDAKARWDAEREPDRLKEQQREERRRDRELREQIADATRAARARAVAYSDGGAL